MGKWLEWFRTEVDCISLFRSDQAGRILQIRFGLVVFLPRGVRFSCRAPSSRNVTLNVTKPRVPRARFHRLHQPRQAAMDKHRFQRLVAVRTINWWSFIASHLLPLGFNNWCFATGSDAGSEKQTAPPAWLGVRPIHGKTLRSPCAAPRRSLSRSQYRFP